MYGVIFSGWQQTYYNVHSDMPNKHFKVIVGLVGIMSSVFINITTSKYHKFWK